MEKSLKNVLSTPVFKFLECYNFSMRRTVRGNGVTAGGGVKGKGSGP